LDGVCQLLGKGRKDESGDFTKGADLNDGQISKIVSFASHGLILGSKYSNAEFTPKLPIRRVEDGGWIPDDRFADDDALGDDSDPLSGTFWDNSKTVEWWAELISSSRTGSDGLRELSEINSLLR